MNYTENQILPERTLLVSLDTGEYDAENRVMYYDMATAEESNFRNNVAKAE